jgi:hypothetical protein
MPNSVWTETASSTSLLLVTSPVDGSSPENVNYLTNADKITLMAQYAAALATKTSLDTLAASLSISSSFYDGAVANISSALITAGAPSNWATTWPDGTTSGPWTNIQGDLANLWAQIASQQTALQAAISAAQAAAAYSTAVAAAATAATTQLSAAVNVLTDAPLVVSGLPTLPNVTYPIGRQVLNSVDGKIYTNNAGAWVALAVPAASLSGQIVATQITPNSITTSQIAANAITAGQIAANAVTAGTVAAAAIGATQIAAGSITAAALTLTAASLIPDPDFASGAAGWIGFVQRQLSSAAAVPSGCPGIYAAQFNGLDNVNRNTIPVNAGETYFVSLQGNPNGGSGSGGGGVGISLYPYNAAGTMIGGQELANATAAGWNTLTGTYSVPTGTVAISVGPRIGYAGGGFVNGSAGPPWFTNMVLRRMTDASLIVDGTITAAKISAGAITADMITTGTLNAALVSVTNLNANNITTGTLAASKVLFSDGTSVATAARVTTSQAQIGTSTPLESYAIAIPNFYLTATATAASDVFNFNVTLIVQSSAYVADTYPVINIQAYVDGGSTPAFSLVLPLPCVTTSSTSNVASFMFSVTGLTPGTHTIQLWAYSSGGVSTLVGTSYMVAQQIVG